IGVDRNELVEAVSEALDAERPDVDVILLYFDQIANVRRVAGFIRSGPVACDEREERKPCCGEPRRSSGSSHHISSGCRANEEPSAANNQRPPVALLPRVDQADVQSDGREHLLPCASTRPDERSRGGSRRGCPAPGDGC